jgi:hypothetical protein
MNVNQANKFDIEDNWFKWKKKEVLDEEHYGIVITDLLLQTFILILGAIAQNSIELLS